MLDDEADTIALHGLQAFTCEDRCDDTGLHELAFLRPVDIVLKIGQHFEMLGKLRIESCKQEIEQPVAKQNDL
jgi:hypothetical protein